jgi:hypothetical protein
MNPTDELAALRAEVSAALKERDKYKQRLSDEQERFAWAKSMEAEVSRLREREAEARRALVGILDEVFESPERGWLNCRICELAHHEETAAGTQVH